jgi:hypothetical protein
MPGDVIANLAYIQARMDHQDEETTNRERQVTRNTNLTSRWVAPRSRDGTFSQKSRGVRHMTLQATAIFRGTRISTRTSMSIRHIYRARSRFDGISTPNRGPRGANALGNDDYCAAGAAPRRFI